MLKEKYSLKIKETALNIVQTKIQSVRKKNITKTAYRIFENGKIGIYGKIGDFCEEDLIEKARENLNLNIEYPFELTENINKSETFDCIFKTENEFIEEIDILLKKIKDQNPNFTFFNKIKLINESTSLNNDKNTNLKYEAKYYEISLIIKEKSSSNIMDLGYGFETHSNYNRDLILEEINELCSAYLNKNDKFEDGYYPVIFLEQDYIIKQKFFNELNGIVYGSGSSIFSNKINEKLFDEKLTLMQSKNINDGIYSPFFDFEGTVNKDYRYNLIENGIIKSPFTSKKYSKLFNLPLTGASSGDFDSVPDLTYTPLTLEDSGKTIKDLLNGKKGIFVLISSGGDYTPDGKFGAPVQVAFLHDGEKFISKLPELNISSHIYDMYGKDFIGVSSDNLSSLYKSNVAIFNMKVNKI